MLLNDLPNGSAILDTETISTLLHSQRTNRNLSIFAGLIQNADVITATVVRSEYLDFSGRPWAGDGLENLIVKRRDKRLAQTVADMVDHCIANGVDPYSPVVRPKLNLVALARMNDACVVSVDDRDTNVSMKTICNCFGIPFVAVASIEL